jgi:hypothetical protein
MIKTWKYGKDNHSNHRSKHSAEEAHLLALMANSLCTFWEGFLKVYNCIFHQISLFFPFSVLQY